MIKNILNDICFCLARCVILKQPEEKYLLELLNRHLFKDILTAPSSEISEEIKSIFLDLYEALDSGSLPSNIAAENSLRKLCKASIILEIEPLILFNDMLSEIINKGLFTYIEAKKLLELPWLKVISKDEILEEFYFAVEFFIHDIEEKFIKDAHNEELITKGKVVLEYVVDLLKIKLSNENDLPEIK